YHLPRARHYLRKQLSVRCPSGSCRLFRADLDNWQGVPRQWQSMKMDSLPYGSHPIYSGTLFGGVEFVAAFNQYSDHGFTLRSRPGGLAIGSKWLPLRSTIIGVSAPGETRYAFLDYLEDVRLAPPRMVACYNSWWTLPTVVIQQDNLDLIRRLKSELYDRHGIFFDIITTDMGWSDPRTVWAIDRSQLPSGFDDVAERGLPAGLRLRVDGSSRLYCAPP
ncbi:MAG: hypothetical protein NTY38_10895, partial [Acidobacteria bacterium]|nr:hypothetical protein [Acidobacteriota bacterium]